MNPNQIFRSRIINAIFLSGFFVAIAASFARYYYLKEFPIEIEVPCNPETELCFARDCEEEECPPNGLEYYRHFQLPGHDFETCEFTDGCESLCKSSPEICVETVCGDSEEDNCEEIDILLETETTTQELEALN